MYSNFDYVNEEDKNLLGTVQSTIFTVSVGYKTSDLHRLHVTLSDIGDFDTFLGSLLLVNAIYILF